MPVAYLAGPTVDPFSHLALTSLVSRNPKVLLAGLLPDAPWYLLYPIWLWRRRVELRAILQKGKWPLPPPWIQHSHYAAHSLLALLLVWVVGRSQPERRKLYAVAWLLHLLVDIPTHSRDRMGPRVFWPFSGWAFNGVSWADGLARGLCVWLRKET